MEYYLAIQKNEAVINATTLIILRNIILRERSQVQDHMLHEFSRIDKSIDRRRLVVAKGRCIERKMWSDC